MAKTWGQEFAGFFEPFFRPDDWTKDVNSKRNIDMDAEDAQAHRVRQLNKSIAKKERAGRTSQFTPDTEIEQLAYTAAQWLVENWPRKSAEVGPALFLAQRVQEILKGEFPAPYWDPCPLVAEETRKAFPTVDYNAPQPPAKFVTPGSKNTKCTYTTTIPSTGNAGNAGHTLENGFFVDDYSKQKNYKFQIPAPNPPSTPRPLFAVQEATFRVSHSHDNRQAFSNLFKASVSATMGGFRLESEAVDQRGRFYYWHKKCPPIDPATLTATMTRRFVVDANYKKWDDGYNDREGGFALIQAAPAPPRGTYRYMSPSVFVDQANTMALFVGVAENEEDPEATPGGFVFQVYQGDLCAVRLAPGEDGTYDLSCEIYLAAEPANTPYNLQAVLKMWRDFRPNDPIPGLPASVGRFRYSYTDYYNGQQCNPYPVGSAGLFAARPDKVIHTFVRPWTGSRSPSKEAYAQNTLDYYLGYAGSSYYAGASGWVRRNCMKDPAFWTNKFRVRIYPDQISISWIWPGATGSATLKPGQPFPVLPWPPSTP